MIETSGQTFLEVLEILGDWCHGAMLIYRRSVTIILKKEENCEKLEKFRSMERYFGICYPLQSRVGVKWTFSIRFCHTPPHPTNENFTARTKMEKRAICYQNHTCHHFCIDFCRQMPSVWCKTGCPVDTVQGPHYLQKIHPNLQKPPTRTHTHSDSHNTDLNTLGLTHTQTRTHSNTGERKTKGCCLSPADSPFQVACH